MTGVSVDMGPSPEQAELQAIYTGGANFMARMAALSDAKAAAEKALADLNLGRMTKAKMEKLEADGEAAHKKHEEAKEVLKKASDEASGLLADAQARAARLVAEAEASAKAQAEAAKKYAEEVDAYYKATKADADKLKAEASAIHNDATNMKASVEAEKDTHKKAMAVAKDRKAVLEAKIKKLQGVADKLAASLKEAEEE